MNHERSTRKKVSLAVFPRAMKRRTTSMAGFTLLEVLVATLVMGIAVAGVLNGLAGASRNAARLTGYDRATILAKSQMDALLADRTAPRNRYFGGDYDPDAVHCESCGWQARVTAFEAQRGAGAGAEAVDRVELEIWWTEGPVRRSFSLEGFRRNILRAEDFQRR